MPSKYERYGIQIPESVQRAIKLAEALNFPIMPEGRSIGFKGPASACIPEVGRLLSVLAAARPNGRIAELGTGAGIGTAWLASAMPPTTTLVSVEIDSRLAEAVGRLFANYANVEIRIGDWMEVLADEPPFDLVFMDAAAHQYLAPAHWDRVAEMLKLGGQIIFDDLAPLELWPPTWDDLVDLKREFAFHNPRMIGTEVRTTATQVAIIVTRVK
jgi:predicted O-methyltransferase YrrM